MKISRLLVAVLLVPLTLTQITFPTKAESSVRHMANLVVFVEFNDTTHNHVNDDGSSLQTGTCYRQDPQIEKLFDGGSQSLKQYLKTISYGQLEVENLIPQYDSTQNKVTPCVLEMSTAEYANGLDGDTDLISMVAEQLQNQDFSGQTLDYDGDQCLDNLMIILPAEPSNGNITGRKHTYSGSAEIAGTKIGSYTIIPEWDAYFGYKKSGVIIHEFLHTVGYPDLYWGNAPQGSNPVGDWDIMASDSQWLQYPLAYLRSKYTNWFDISEVTESQTGYTLYAATSTDENTKDQQAVILKTDQSSSEYFVLEYRKQGKLYSNEYEQKLPGSGLIIYRVNTAASGNRQGAPFEVYVFRSGDTMEGKGEKADYTEDKKNSTYLSAESGRTAYGSEDPAADLSDNALVYSDGTNSGIVIENVGSAAGDQISFDITFHEMDADAGEKWSAESKVTAMPSGYNSPKIAVYEGQVYVSYLDSSWKVKMDQWDGTAWKNIISSGDMANDTELQAGMDGVILSYVNQDGKTVSAYQYTADGSVHKLQTFVNKENSEYLANPVVSEANGTVYLAYRDAYQDSKLIVKKYDVSADQWVDVQDIAEKANGFILKQNGSKLYLLKNGIGTSESGISLYVLDTSEEDAEWKLAGGSKVSEIDGNMALGFNGAVPYVACTDGSGTVGVWALQNGQWSMLGNKVYAKNTGMDIGYADGKACLAYLDSETEMLVMRTLEAQQEPSEPEQPSEPTTPSEPETPSQPEQPTTPSTPSKPEVPATPSAPTQPSKPEQPTTPAQPVEPVTPTEPEQPTTVPSEPEVPAAPQYTADESIYGLHAAALNYKTIQLTWNKVNGATGYEVYYSTSPDSGYQFLKKLGKGAKKYKFTKAVCGTSYYFKIRPIQKVKKVITYLEESNPVTTSTVSDPVKNLKAKAQKNGKVRLTWKKAKGIAAYVILRSDSIDGEYQQIGSTGKNSCMNIELEIGKTYYYKVYGVQGSYQTDECGPVGVTTK